MVWSIVVIINIKTQKKLFFAYFTSEPQAKWLIMLQMLQFLYLF